MERLGYKAKTKQLIIAGIAGAIVLLFLLFGPPRMLAKSESPEFCVQCHVMASEYESWLHQGAHRRIKCVDCHLPNGNTASHYSWKAVDGLKDVAMFYSGMAPEQIALTSRGEQVLQENCVRCHETTVENIDLDRKCWECHRRLMHKRSGLMETLL